MHRQMLALLFLEKKNTIFKITFINMVLAFIFRRIMRKTVVVFFAYAKKTDQLHSNCTACLASVFGRYICSPT